MTDRQLGVQGSYSCRDSKRGDFRTAAIDVNAISLEIQMTIQLTGTESCSIDAILSMARSRPEPRSHCTQRSKVEPPAGTRGGAPPPVKLSRKHRY